MKIGIDLDGVVFDTEILWSVLAEIYDCKELKKNSIKNKGEPKIQDKYNWSPIEEKEYLDRYVDIKDFNIVSYAKQVIELLKNEGNELIVITARGILPNSIDGIKIAKERLEKENIVFDKYYWRQENKLDICKKENIDIMIDDNYHICKTLSENNIKTLYFRTIDRKQIEQNDNLIEVTTWGEVYRYIHELSNRVTHN